MTRSELHTLAQVTCCICDRHLTAAGLAAFRNAVGRMMHGEVYCRSCMETHLIACRECSVRYAVDTEGICADCASRKYATAG